MHSSAYNKIILMALRNYFKGILDFTTLWLVLFLCDAYWGSLISCFKSIVDGKPFHNEITLPFK